MRRPTPCFHLIKIGALVQIFLLILIRACNYSETTLYIYGLDEPRRCNPRAHGAALEDALLEQLNTFNFNLRYANTVSATHGYAIGTRFEVENLLCRGLSRIY